MALSDYFHGLLRRYLGFYCSSPGDKRTVEVDPPHKPVFEGQHPTVATSNWTEADTAALGAADFVLLNSSIHYEPDLLRLFSNLRRQVKEDARLLIVYYSAFWRPAFALATAWGIRAKTAEQNWISHEDIKNVLALTDFEPIVTHHKVIMPFYVPLLSELINRFLSQLPVLSWFCMANIAVVRPVTKRTGAGDSLSVIAPLRNESGNVARIFDSLPEMRETGELVIVEGNSTDDTWEEVQRRAAQYKGPWKVVLLQQTGKGKGDAVRLGFAHAQGDILVILDGDLTVPPKEIPNFVTAIATGKGEFINGSRLVYPQEKRAMRFANLVANKSFALSFSYVLGQQLKDTLCGTKVLRRTDYLAIAQGRSYFGEFDPFGDFDLLFGAAKLGMKIVEVPVHYQERTYGTTNIQRWRHGVILARMLIFAAARIKFI